MDGDLAEITDALIMNIRRSFWRQWAIEFVFFEMEMPCMQSILMPYSTGCLNSVYAVLNHRRQLGILMKIAIYGTKSYDREHFTRANKHFGFEAGVFDFMLVKTAKMAREARSGLYFVNDDGSKPVLEKLAQIGVKTVALRCLSFNNVDLKAAEELGLKVVRVPALFARIGCGTYGRSDADFEPPYPQSYQRTRDANFSLKV